MNVDELDQDFAKSCRSRIGFRVQTHPIIHIYYQLSTNNRTSTTRVNAPPYAELCFIVLSYPNNPTSPLMHIDIAKASRDCCK